jgi:protein-S-isoprenylcysteine O-methyltransferase Ste14
VPRLIAALTLALVLGMVLTRAWVMSRRGVQAMNFGKIDKTDFLIPPFALFYFYLVCAAAFNLPTVSAQAFFQSEPTSWVGSSLCLIGVALLLWSLLSFGRSFRVGIDTDHPDTLVTTGVFAYSRNPIYVAFALIVLGEFVTSPNWILLLYVGAAAWLFHRQVSREEAFLRQHYGKAYTDYCSQVRRYI